MNQKYSFSNRRSSSQLLPRVYLLLQVGILVLLSYIIFSILMTYAFPYNYIITALGVGNIYFLTKVFFKCRFVAQRANVIKRFY